MKETNTLTEMTMEAREAGRPKSAADAASFQVLGVRVNAVRIPDIVEAIERWVGERSATNYIAVTGMHGVAISRNDPEFRGILNGAGLVIPDGMPLVWLGRLQGHRELKRRTPGAEVMEAFFQATGAKYRHFFYGGVPGVADLLAKTERERHGIRIAGTYCPPFRPLTQAEEQQVQSMIREAKPDILWVGLSTPKQERWMYEHRDNIRVPVMLGVGAAFDLNVGRLKRAPLWMQNSGLEWLFRLILEPRRLWRRYILDGSRFVWAVWLEHILPRLFRRPVQGSQVQE
jgi:N-acetylglucosaminyldiphosphoundecaprenol N-acetyl-beta-D-mannosaminyltransferase